MKYPISFKYRFELLLPLTDNEGNPFEPEIFFQVQQDLLERFSGYRCQSVFPATILIPLKRSGCLR